MIKNYENKEIKLNADLGGYKKGTTISIKVDSEGTPLDRYWRDRVKDSKMDGCVEFSQEQKGEASKSKPRAKTVKK